MKAGGHAVAFGISVVALAFGCLSCTRHDVSVEPPSTGRALTDVERRAIQAVADEAFRDARASLEGLPPRLTLIVNWGKDVIPETGENGAAAYPGNIGWTLDPDRNVLAAVRARLRSTLFHELHHLARASRVETVTLVDHVVSEGLATAFERDFGGAVVPWGEPPSDGIAWAHEILGQPETAPLDTWIYRHPDGRRWIGMRVGTFLADRASKASGKSPAALVFAPSAEVVRLAEVR